MSPSSEGRTFPEFEGRCAFGLSIGSAAKAPRGKGDHTLVRNGLRYMFASRWRKLLFRVIPGSAARAHKHWDAAW